MKIEIERFHISFSLSFKYQTINLSRNNEIELTYRKTFLLFLEDQEKAILKHKTWHIRGKNQYSLEENVKSIHYLRKNC